MRHMGFAVVSTSGEDPEVIGSGNLIRARRGACAGCSSLESVRVWVAFNSITLGDITLGVGRKDRAPRTGHGGLNMKRSGR